MRPAPFIRECDASVIWCGVMRIPSDTGARAFARKCFRHAELGDERRSSALVDIVTGLVRNPAGRITQVFQTSAARERAYRFVGNAGVKARALTSALATAVGAILNRASMSYVVVDGSSLTLADPRGRKDFGQVGIHRNGARGLKVITAYAVSESGVPLGVLWQEFWARLKRTRRGIKSTDNRRREVSEKETQRWLDVIREAARHVVPGKAWFLIDREGDSRVMLQTLAALDQRFTVRSSWNRLLVAGRNGRRRYLRGVMAKALLFASYAVDVSAAHKRKARTAKMAVRTKRVQLLLKDRWHGTSSVLEVNVVWALEVGTTPHGEKPLDWMLLTNAPIVTSDDALAVVRSYQARWRIEDFHKTWKSGRCNVEETQLHSMRAATIFAVMHAAVAARAEHLKHLSRETPDQPAAIELSAAERKAIALLAYDALNQPVARGGRRQSREVPPDAKKMTIGEAILWIARFGGYTGKSSGGPPGAIVIGRGLDFIAGATSVLSAAAALRRK
jgi:hypothetical protein